MKMELLKKGSRGKAVKMVQEALHLMADGIFGKLTEEAVRTFQREHGLVADGIVGEKTWKAIFSEPSGQQVADAPAGCGVTLKKSVRRIDEIFVHCTATREGEDRTVADLRREHMKQGWADIGYHYVVYRDGTVHDGRDVDKVGAHVSGHNSHSIGVVYVGGLENLKGVPYKELPAKDTRTDEQRGSLRSLVACLKRLYPGASVLGHRDVSPDKNGDGLIEPWEWIKSCPSFDAREEYKNI